MLRTRTLALVFAFMLAVASLGLAGCTGGDESSDDTTESTSEETATEESDDPIVGTWTNAEANFYSEITFAADGTGMLTELDGSETEMTWTIEDDFLDFQYADGSIGGGFYWNEEGAEFEWDIDGVYTLAE